MLRRRVLQRGNRTHRSLAAWLAAVGLVLGCKSESAGTLEMDGIWIGRDVLASLPTEGPAWEQVFQEAQLPAERPNLSDQDERTNVRLLAKALVAVRTGNDDLRYQVIDAIHTVMGTEKGARTLAVGRKLAAYVIAADLVRLPPEEDARFRAWLRELLGKKLRGESLRSTHEKRPNNWGTHAGASRAAAAAYLGDRAEMERTAKVFRGWLGDRSAYADFEFGEMGWQADRGQPVGINPKGANRDGHSLDGVLPDDQRRAGGFTWPPPQENYVYGALQGALVQAMILHRAGYDVWESSERALLRAFTWLQEEAHYPPHRGTTPGSCPWSIRSTAPNSGTASRRNRGRTSAGPIGHMLLVRSKFLPALEFRRRIAPPGAGAYIESHTRPLIRPQ